jgi:hypothetical protein
MSWIDELISEYHKWLKTKFVVTEDSKTDWVMITTPFVGMFNDLLELYAQKKDNKIILSDNGETINNLELVGAKVNRGERKDIFNKILLNYGLTLKNDELILEFNEREFPQKKHNFLSALIELNEIYMLSREKVTSIFKDDVREFFEEQDIIYTPDFISKGNTGLEFTFDFQIAHKNREIVIKAFNSLNKLNLPSFLFAWEDIKPLRESRTSKEVKAIAFVNDINKVINIDFVEALNSKNADYILWSEKSIEKNLAKLAA